MVGFWIRLLADIIDNIILGIFGILLTLPFNSIFYKIGDHCIWIGISIIFLYTGILQSSIGQGQSLAKKLLKIQVLRKDGTYLSLPQSFLRYLIIAVIFYNPPILASLISLFPFLNTSFTFTSGYSFLILSLMIGTSILVAFHPLKRGLHDMLVNSIVVIKGTYDAEKIEAMSNPSKTRKIFIVFGSSCLLLFIVLFFVLPKILPQDLYSSETLKLSQKIEQNTQLTKISISYTSKTSRHNDGPITKTKYANLSFFLKKSKFDNEQLRLAQVEKAVNIFIDSEPKISQFKYINVQIRTGYNLVISSRQSKHNYSYTTDGKPYEQ